MKTNGKPVKNAVVVINKDDYQLTFCGTFSPQELCGCDTAPVPPDFEVDEVYMHFFNKDPLINVTRIFNDFQLTEKLQDQIIELAVDKYSH